VLQGGGVEYWGGCGYWGEMGGGRWRSGWGRGYGGGGQLRGWVEAGGQF
jgi:hypothetical protein